jgi:hypothetical protein
MSNPQADPENFQTAPTEPHHGIAREGVDGPTELARRQELPYDDSTAVAAVGMFFAGIFIIALALFFFAPGPQRQGGLATNETGAHADRASPIMPQR